MSTVGPTCSPNSFQLRLALNCRRPSVSLVRVARLHKLDRRFRLVSSLAGDNAKNNVGSDRSPVRDSWTNGNYSAESFSGWSGDNGGESQQKKRQFGGIIGAGAAGVVLVVGISFAALSLSKRNTKGLKMESLTAQEELSLTSDSHGSTDNNHNEDNDVKNEITSEGTTGKDGDYSSFEVNNEVVSEDRQIDGDLNHTVNGNDATERNSILEDTESESFGGDTSIVPDGSPETTRSIGSGEAYSSKSYDNLVSERPESFAEVMEENYPSSTSDVSENINVTDNKGVSLQDKEGVSYLSFGSLPSSTDDIVSESVPSGEDVGPQNLSQDNIDSVDSISVGYSVDLITDQVLVAENTFPHEHIFIGAGLSGYASVSAVTDTLATDKQEANIYSSISGSKSNSEYVKSGKSFSSAGIPAPSVVSAALQVVPGKVLVPAVVDHVQGQALAALQVLKVVEADAQPGDLCTRREYARWLVSASSALSRSTVSKVYPAMYIENVTDLAFDDVTPEDPDFPSIQGLAEAGLIASKLSRHDLSSSLDDDESSLFFSPQSPLSRQDLVSWKMALDTRLLPEADIKQLSGFIDINKINPGAWPAIAADVAAGEQGIIALAFGYTRLFHPDKPVTKAQAAIALATGEASDIVNEELARIEAESLAENAVTVHNALVAEVERDVNATFEKELLLERQKIDALDKMAAEARLELENLRAEREADKITLMKERIAVESEMEVLSRLRHEMEEQLEGLLSNKVEISYEKERIDKLRKEVEFENDEIARLQHELEVERKALSLARSWAEDEAKRARAQAKILEEARERWERHGIKVVVDDDLREEENVGVTWANTAKQLSVEGTVSRAENIVDKLKAMAESVREKSKATILSIIQKMQSFINSLKEWAQELTHSGLSKMNGSLQELQQKSAEYTSAVQEGAKRIGEECRGNIEKLTQKFRT